MMETTKLGHWKSCCNRKECSECGFVYYAQRPEFKFCPSCGAKMDKNELLENPEQLVKTHDILVRDGKKYEVVTADNNIFVVCLVEYVEFEGSWIARYDAPEIYANQSSINTLEELRFTLLGARMDGDDDGV